MILGLKSQLTGGRPVSYLQVIRSVVFVGTPVEVILAWPAIYSQC